MSLDDFELDRPHHIVREAGKMAYDEHYSRHATGKDLLSLLGVEDYSELVNESDRMRFEQQLRSAKAVIANLSQGGYREPYHGSQVRVVHDLAQAAIWVANGMVDDYNSSLAFGEPQRASELYAHFMDVQPVSDGGSVPGAQVIDMQEWFREHHPERLEEDVPQEPLAGSQ